jgi:hypothetical protein
VSTLKDEPHGRPIGSRPSRAAGTVAVPLLVLALLLLPALWPLLGDRFTCGYDNSFHLWRAVEVHNLLRQGVLYPRWAADMAHGYGFPLFNFVSPLSAFAAAGLRFAGLPWVRAVNGTFALGMFLSGLTMFLFVRDRFGDRAGLVSAVAYVYAPFQAYDAFNRGGMSQAFAWWLPPLLLWSLDRWHSRRGGIGALLLASGSMAALILTHNVFAFLFAPLIVGLLLLPRDGHQTASLRAAWPGRRELARGLLPVVLGLGLTTFFWLPGLAERDWVQTQRLLGVWVFDYRNNFLQLKHLLALPRRTDPTLVNDWPPRSLGLVPAALALLPLGGWRRFSLSQRGLLLLFLAGMLLFALMTLPLSRPLWDHLPLLPYVQFPWRFLGPAAFCAAVLAGAAVPALGATGRRATPVAAVVIVLLFLANQGWFFPDHCAPPGDTSVAGMIRWEGMTDTLGATAGGEYLPTWVQQVPDPASLLVEYERGGPVRRLDEEALPAGASVVAATYSPLGAELVLDTPEPFHARYLAFYYPGWRVDVDGQAADVQPSQPSGLISFPVPAGRHEIRVRFGPTPLRAAATILSWVTLLGLGAVAFLLRPSQRGGPLRRDADAQPWSWRAGHLLPFLGVALLLLLLRVLIAEGCTPLRQSRLAGLEDSGAEGTPHLQGVHQPYAVNFGGRWMLLGRDALPQSVESGGSLEVTLYWRALEPQGRDYAAALALVDAAGRRWTQAGMRTPRWHRTPPPVYTWPADGYGITAYLADLLPGTPPGDYRLVLTTFDREDPLTPLTAHAPDGTALGPSLDLGSVQVTRPGRHPEPDQIPMQTRLNQSIGPLTLAGVNLDRDTAAPGDPMQISLFWLVEREGELPELMAHLTLADASGAPVAEWTLPPVSDDWPTTRWQPGDLWRGQHLFRLPGRLESGIYRWELQLSDPATRFPESPLPLGHLRVEAPERLWDQPPLQIPLAVELGGVVTLLGVDLAPASALARPISAPATLNVTLAWQAGREMETSYRVFLHLLGSDGRLLIQSDGEPADWARPTTGWAPGEVVLDPRKLGIPADAPAGTYRLVVGLYHPDTGVRLLDPDGRDAVTIGALTITEP